MKLILSFFFCREVSPKQDCSSTLFLWKFKLQIFTMEATATFNSVIDFVENSNLNYFINKTPFSAIISIKSSFIKRFEDASKHVKVNKIKEAEEESVEKLKNENLILLERLKVAKSTDEETAALEKNLKVALTEQNRLENIAKIKEVT